MRLVVLLCGVLSGAVGLGFGWWSQHAEALRLESLSTPMFVAAVIALHVVGLLAIGGGAAVLAFPRVGGVMMLVSAMGWLAIVAVVGGGLALPIGLLIAASAAGGLLAFLPSLNRPWIILERADGPRDQQLAARRRRPDAPDGAGVVVEDDEDHSQPFRAPGLEIADDERRDRPGSPYTFRNGKVQHLSYHPKRQKRSMRGRTVAGLLALGAVLILVPMVLVLDAQTRGAGDNADTISPETVQTAAAEQSLVQPAAASESLAPAPPQTSLAVLPVPEAYATPFDYCEGVVTSDAPPASQVTEGLPADLIAGVREVTKMPTAEVVWRCMERIVWICAQSPGGNACARTPDTRERAAYCAANPDASGISTPVGQWRCDGTEPVVSEAFERTLDPRGFDRTAWLSLTKAAP